MKGSSPAASGAANVEELVLAGAPFVLYYWARGQFEWFEVDEAAEQWAVGSVLGVISREPGRRKVSLEWTGGTCESEAKSLVLLTGHC